MIAARRTEINTEDDMLAKVQLAGWRIRAFLAGCLLALAWGSRP